MKNWILLAGLALITGCTSAPSGDFTDEGQGLEGARLARVYATIERVYREESKFRTDYEPADAPYDAATLANNFAVVAQRSETQTIGETVVVEGDSIPVTRWEMPIRLWTTGQTARDIAHLDALSARIEQLTPLSVEPVTTSEDANVFILIADADERRDLVGAISSVAGERASPLVTAWPDLPEYPCIARVFIDPQEHTLQMAMILVKAELSGDFRTSCLTEEFVQALGLFNDGPEVRPSIFNDDAEFIELTRHDEYLLQILYDRRLRPGMLRAEAEPIVREIAAELLADAGT